jgi:hypothetical protein
MSRQVNFFADGDDARRLHSKLFEVFPHLKAVPAEPGSEHEFHGRPAQDLMSAERIYLVPAWAVSRIVLRPVPGGQFRVDQKTSPVLEYCRSIVDADNETITAGRLYWAFEGDISAEEARQIGRVFRWVNDQTVATPLDRRFRVFEAAARKRRVLDYGFGITERSPQWRT